MRVKVMEAQAGGLKYGNQTWKLSVLCMYR